MSNKVKDMLENKFKESLNNFEMEYDPKAWESLSKSLDSRLPIKKNPFTKWIFGGAAIAIIGVSAYFLSLENEKQKTAVIKQNKPELVNENLTETKPNKTEKKNESKVLIPNHSDLTKNTEDISSEAVYSEKQQLISYQNTAQEVKETADKSVTIIDINKDILNGMPKGVMIPKGFNTESENRITLPEITDICSGEVLNIEPIQGHTIIIEDPNGNIYRISNSSDKFTAGTEGQHLVWIDGVSREIEYQSFTVKSSPKIDIEIIDKNLFENGLPTTKLSTNAISNNYSWKFEGMMTSIQSKEASVHYFKKGTYQVELTVKNDLGCSNTADQNITVDEDYNLLAVNGFDPQSNDNRKNAFIPFALTQRSVTFRMIIVDPKDGGIVFESNDASNPWRGNDARTGQMVEPNKAYIWQVIIDNPEEGEKSEYKGTIVRM